MSHLKNRLSLEDYCLKVCCRFFSALPALNKEKLFTVHKYLECAAPLVQKIAKKCHYHFSVKKSLIFVPFLLQRGELILTDQNISEVTTWIDSFSLTDQKELIRLDKLIVNAPRAENYFKLLPFISKLSCITKLELSSWTTDDVLAAVGMHCKMLEVLDARGDGETVITDTGLGFLSQCKTLKMVLFSNVADEYDYEDKLKFTGKGIALLMLCLNNLQRIECPEYLLRDALQYIYQMNFQHPVLPLKCLFLAYPDVPPQTISILPYLCPHIDTLSVYIPVGKENIFNNSLKRLLSLKKLKLKFEDSCNLSALNMVDHNSQIERLVVDAQFVHEKDVYQLCLTFTRLRILVFTIHSFGFVPRTTNDIENSGLPRPLFPRLHTIQFDQRVSARLFKLLNINIKTLKALYCQHAVIYDIENAIEAIISNGGWSHLEILALPQNCSFSCQFLFQNLTKLSNLKLLSVKFTSETEEKNFLNLIYKTMLRFQLCSIQDLPRTDNDFMAV